MKQWDFAVVPSTSKRGGTFDEIFISGTIKPYLRVPAKKIHLTKEFI